MKFLVALFSFLISCGPSIPLITSINSTSLLPQRPISILCLGDSLTSGHRYDELDQPHSKVAWRGQFLLKSEAMYGIVLNLEGNEVDENPPSWWHHLHHAGVISQLVDDPRHLKPSILSMRERVPKELARVQPDIVILMGGLNDLVVGYTIPETIEHIRATLVDIHRHAPRAKLVVSTEVTYLPMWQKSIELIETTRKNRPTFVGGTRVIETCNDLRHPEDFAVDDQHPNRHGYEMIGHHFAVEMEETFREVLAERLE